MLCIARRHLLRIREADVNRRVFFFFYVYESTIFFSGYSVVRNNPESLFHPIRIFDTQMQIIVYRIKIRSNRSYIYHARVFLFLCGFFLPYSQFSTTTINAFNSGMISKYVYFSKSDPSMPMAFNRFLTSAIGIYIQ